MSGTSHCTGAILAGGRSTRMGGVSKGLERVQGERMIDRVAVALRVACDELIVVSNDELAAEWIPGVPVVRDERPGAGALSGVHAALKHATLRHAEGAAIVLAWDSPFVPGTLLRALRETGERTGADAVVTESDSPDGFEPLCAWYAPSCRAAVERRLDAGEFRAAGWQSDVVTRRLDPSPWGDPRVMLFNVNTPDDLRRAAFFLAAPV